MKGVLVWLYLLGVLTAKICSKPYQADKGMCRNQTIEYLQDDSNLCCQKCRPGFRMKDRCTEDTETVCEQCQQETYMEGWNYTPNCRSCTQCKSKKGLQNALPCSSTKNSKCVCQPGMFCTVGFDNPYCSDCRKYTVCHAGHGVSVQGTPRSNVKCEPCTNGTFSDTVSSTDPCKPHTNCNGQAVLKKGNATSDTVCEISETDLTSLLTSTTVTTTAATTSTSAVSYETRNSTSSTVSSSVEKIKPAIMQLDGILAIFTGSALFLICFIFLLYLYKRVWRKVSVSIHKDENGNCESGDKQIGQSYLGGSQMTSFSITSPEKVCLLENGEASSDQSQCSNNSDTLTKTDGYSSRESVQSTLPLNNLNSDLSEPMSLLSNTTEPVSPQASIPTQSSSKPTSPQIISPVTNNPHVNVNITLHIGNGSYGTSSLMPTDLKQEECVLPFGEEDESFSIPQQEAGKQSLISVQESTTYSDEDSCA